MPQQRSSRAASPARLEYTSQNDAFVYHVYELLTQRAREITGMFNIPFHVPLGTSARTSRALSVHQNIPVPWYPVCRVTRCRRVACGQGTGSDTATSAAA
eukprot:2024621-Prymnesium_polylepis.1